MERGAGVVVGALIVAALMFGTTLLVDRGRARWPLLTVASLLNGLTAGLTVWGVLPWWAYIVSLIVLNTGYRAEYSRRFGRGRAGMSRRWPKIRWRRAAVAAGSVLIVFTVTLTAMAALEAATGQSLWGLVTGQRQRSGPTQTVGGVCGSEAPGGPAPNSSPTPSSLPTCSPASTPSP
jgi:hypothetical protein